jgi:mitotic-spindle organizing protein 1
MDSNSRAKESREAIDSPFSSLSLSSLSLLSLFFSPFLTTCHPRLPPFTLFLYFFSDLFEISNILNCGLDKETLAICVSLVESGVNPEALAHVVKELKREAAALVCDVIVLELISLGFL